MVRWSITGITAMIAIVFGLVSCEKEVILELSDREGAYLIVEANIDDATAEQWIRLSLSSSYYDVTEGAVVTGADVMVSSGEGEWIFTGKGPDSLAGFYFNSNIGAELVDGSYTLSIEHEGNSYSAVSEYRAVPGIDSVTTRLNFFSSAGLTDERLYDILVHFADLPGKGDHYLIDLTINGKLQTPRPSQKTVISDQDLGSYVSRSVRTINGNDVHAGDTIRLDMRSISREKYEFYQIFFFQTDLSGNPFAGAPPANIPTNMSEGARGFFQVSAVSKAQTRFRK